MPFLKISLEFAYSARQKKLKIKSNFSKLCGGKINRRRTEADIYPQTDKAH